VSYKGIITQPEYNGTTDEQMLDNQLLPVINELMLPK